MGLASGTITAVVLGLIVGLVVLVVAVVVSSNETEAGVIWLSVHGIVAAA